MTREEKDYGRVVVVDGGGSVGRGEGRGNKKS